MSQKLRDSKDEKRGNDRKWNLPETLTEEFKDIKRDIKEISSRENSKSYDSISSDIIRNHSFFSDETEYETASPLLSLYEGLDQRLTDIESFLLRTSNFIKKTSEPNQPYARDIPRVILDPICNPIWFINTEPSKRDIENLVIENDEFKGYEFKYVLSNIRKWFRKRREELSGKVTSEFRRQHPSVQRRIKDDIEKMKTNIIDNLFDIEFENIREKVDPSRSQDSFKKFARERVLKYLDKSA